MTICDELGAALANFSCWYWQKSDKTTRSPLKSTDYGNSCIWDTQLWNLFFSKFENYPFLKKRFNSSHQLRKLETLCCVIPSPHQPSFWILMCGFLRAGCVRVSSGTFVVCAENLIVVPALRKQVILWGYTEMKLFRVRTLKNELSWKK